MLEKITNRILLFGGFLLCSGLIAAALIMQYGYELNPCPLCILQRLAFICCGLVFLVGGLHYSFQLNLRQFWQIIYGGLGGIFAMLGGLIAARHIQLQNLPAGQIPECGPGLGFMLEAFPLQQVIGLVLRGSGECAEVQWNWLGLTIPEWSLLWLIFLAGLGFFIAVRKSPGNLS